MELCDLYDASGNRTGRSVPRGTAVTDGQEYYLVVHVWIRDATGAYLIQQRSWGCDTDPGVWAVTAGYALSGEASLAAAQREVYEELGLRLPTEALRCWRRLPHEQRLEDLWLATVERAALGAPDLGPEVMDYQWATKAELAGLVETGAFFHYSYFDELPA